MAKFSINKWRKKAISLFGKARGLTQKQRDEVTAAVHGGARSKPRTSVRRSGSKTARKRRSSKKRRGGGRRPFGTVGWKGLLAAIFGLTILRILIRRMFGAVPAEYVDSASLVGTGIVGKATGIGTAHLLTPGIALGGSKLIEDLVSPGGFYTIGGVGNTGGYDF